MDPDRTDPVAGDLACLPVALKETCRVVPGRSWPEAVPLWPLHRERLSRGGCSAAVLDRAEAQAANAVSAPRPMSGPTASAHRASSATAGMSRPRSSDACPRSTSRAGPFSPSCTSAGRPVSRPARRSPPTGRRGTARCPRHAAWARIRRCSWAPTGASSTGGPRRSGWSCAAASSLRPRRPAVPGVARAWLLAEARGLGLDASVEPVRPEDLDLAQEVFLTNAFAGAVPARGRGGPVTAAVTRRVRETCGRDGLTASCVLEGRSPAYCVRSDGGAPSVLRIPQAPTRRHHVAHRPDRHRRDRRRCWCSGSSSSRWPADPGTSAGARPTPRSPRSSRETNSFLIRARSPRVPSRWTRHRRPCGRGSSRWG